MEEDKNIIYSCEEHGIDVYREIKNNSRVPKTHIYCYFPPINEGNRQVHEKMWVKITKGNRKDKVYWTTNQNIITITNYTKLYILKQMKMI